MCLSETTLVNFIHEKIKKSGREMYIPCLFYDYLCYILAVYE